MHDLYSEHYKTDEIIEDTKKNKKTSLVHGLEEYY